ncbi:MAG: hypothetical protein JSV82_05510 [Planctomycetota bacterium]|nr:MAG: hypothetical protein JSV82_05510 [Planctomycetota bacterium]
MGRRKRLTARQLAVLDDLFGSELEESSVLEKHGVRRSTYDRWLGEKVFGERFKQHLNGLKRRSELLMAKYSCLAAAKLVELTASGKEETARKACLDIMTMPNKISDEVGQVNRTEGGEGEELSELSIETASKLLAVMAEEI